MHFAAVAYVGESTLYPLKYSLSSFYSSKHSCNNLLHFSVSLIICIFVYFRYYHNITSNTLGVLEAMARHKVKKLIYSSTCATYGEPEKMPITEDTPQVNINFSKFLS